MEALQVPVVGGDVLTDDWNSSPYLFPQGAGIRSQLRGMLRLAVEKGHRTFGELYCVEIPSCKANKSIVAERAGEMGGTWAYETPISVTQPDFTAQCQNAKAAGVDALFLGMDGSSMQRTARSCAAVGYHPLYVASGLTLSATQALDPNLRRDGLATANMIAPWRLEDTVGQREYRRALATWAPSQQPDGPSIAGWASGKPPSSTTS